MVADPLALWRADRDAAFAAGDSNAGLCWFATQSARQGPSVRTLVLRDLGPEIGFAVFLNLSSPKAAELAVDARCELVCFYPSLQVQVRARASTRPLPNSLLAEHWPKRPEPGRRMDRLYSQGWGQSTAVDAGALAQAHQQLSPDDLTRQPAGVSGRLLQCSRIERLQLTDNLHRRSRWLQRSDGWQEQALVP